MCGKLLLHSMIKKCTQKHLAHSEWASVVGYREHGS